MKNLLFIKITIIVISLISLFSCKKKEVIQEIPVASSLELHSGDGQEGYIESILPNDIKVIAKDQNGKPYSGLAVYFSTDDGQVVYDVKVTDGNGIVYTKWILSPTVGEQTLIAYAFKTNEETALPGSPLSIYANAMPDKPTSIELIEGGEQSAHISSPLSQQIKFMLKDQDGNPVKGAVVNFSITSGELNADSQVSDSYGIVSVVWTLGPNAGKQILTADTYESDGTTHLSGSPISINAYSTVDIGDVYGGGIVFYTDETSYHGFVCALSDQGTGNEWGCQGTEVINSMTGYALGEGENNTQLIETGCTTPGTASDVCANLSLNGYNDWFLPSRDELIELWNNRVIINAVAVENGGTWFEADYYWTSTEMYTNRAWMLSFASDSRTYLEKSNEYRVRAIRTF